MLVPATANSEAPSDGGTALAFVRMVTAAGVAATGGDAVVVSPTSVATNRVSDQGTHQCGAAGITQCFISSDVHRAAGVWRR